MQSKLLTKTESSEQHKDALEPNAASKGVVLVKAGKASEFRTIIPPAIAVALGLERRIRLIEIMETGGRGGIPVDPVEWDFRKRQAESRLNAVIAQFSESGCKFEAQVLQNHLPSLATNRDDPGFAPIFCCARHNTELPWDLEDSTRRFMQLGCSSVLLVPTDTDTQFSAKYKRILLTLDGSSRAERALPVAVSIARHHQADLLVLHATPDPGLIQTGPLDAEALELQRRLVERNRRIASEYLAKIQSRLAPELLSFTTRLLDKCDVRHQLVDTINSEDAGLVLIASQGATGQSDVPTGSVAKYILEHVRVPVLMVCPEKDDIESGPDERAYKTGPRLPAGAA